MQMSCVDDLHSYIELLQPNKQNALYRLVNKLNILASDFKIRPIGYSTIR